MSMFWCSRCDDMKDSDERSWAEWPDGVTRRIATSELEPAPAASDEAVDERDLAAVAWRDSGLTLNLDARSAYIAGYVARARVVR